MTFEEYAQKHLGDAGYSFQAMELIRMGWNARGEHGEQAARGQGGDSEWLIQMVGEYRITRGNWERPGHRGYTNNIHEAGRYSEAEAKEAERIMPYKCAAVRLPGIHPAPSVPEVIYDGYTVYQALPDDARRRTSPENVSDVLGAVVSVIKRPQTPQQEGEGDE